MTTYLMTKSQENISNYLKYERYYDSAREAMKDFIEVVADMGLKDAPIMVFLPAYIGISPKEGSGIFDPIIELSKKSKIAFRFYKLHKDLSIDLEDVAKKIVSTNSNFILLKVNYFGFCDNREEELFNIVKNSRGILLEDNAHGFFSYLTKDKHFCDVTFFSLHKQFPFNDGGMLLIENPELADLEYRGSIEPPRDRNPWKYDFLKIAKVCRNNYKTIDSIIQKESELFKPLRPFSTIGNFVPQSYPIVLKKSDRFKVYLDLNDEGFGVTSLYHTLIDPIKQNDEYKETIELSSKILNLPVHQDVDPNLYPELVRLLADSCRKHLI